MKIKRLYMQNVLAVGQEPLEILFSDMPGLTLVKGINLDVNKKSSNGAGKSTIIEGIIIGMYGRTLRKENGKQLSMEAILHDENSDLTGKIELEYDDTKIVRSFNPNKLSYWVNGVQQSTNASIIQVKKDLQDHLNVNFETMCSILLFGQHNIFSFPEAGEAEKREVVENLMNLREYNLYEERAKELRKDTKKKIEILTKAHENTVSHHKSQTELLDSQEKKIVEHKYKTQREIDAIKSSISSIPDVTEISKAWEKYNESQETKDKHNKEIRSILDKINETRDQIIKSNDEYKSKVDNAKPFHDQINSIRDKIIALDSKKNEFTKKLDQEQIAAEHSGNLSDIELECQKKISSLDIKEINSLSIQEESIIKEAQSVKVKIAAVKNNNLEANTTCPTCYGKIDPLNAQDVIKHYENDLISLRSQYLSIHKMLEKTTEIYREQKATIIKEAEEQKETASTLKSNILAQIKANRENVEKQYKEKYDQFSSEKLVAENALQTYLDTISTEYENVIPPLEDKIKSLQEHAKQLDKAVKSDAYAKPSISLDEIGSIKSKKESLISQLKEKSESLDSNPYADIVDSLKKAANDLYKKVSDEKDAIAALEKILPYYDFWVDAMGKEGIKSFIIDGIIPTLNDQIEYWMQLIYQGTISVSFDKYLSVSIKNNASKKGLKRYGQGSGGERRRIDIAIMLAFRQIMQMSTGKEPNIVFFDEVAENIDEEGLIWLYDVLQDLAKSTRVYVITHNPGLLALLQKYEVITLVKQNGATSLKTD